MLIKHKAELSDQNAAGATPLALASQEGHEEIVALLLSSGAGLHQCDTSDRSALEVASASDADPELTLARQTTGLTSPFSPVTSRRSHSPTASSARCVCSCRSRAST